MTGNSEKKREIAEESFSDRVIRYIATRGDEDFALLSVSRLAREFKVDRYKLSRSFKAEKNVTLENYLLQEKMCRCAFLLMADRNITVREVSEIMGFCTCDYFIQVFKKYFGIVPGQYKEYKTRRSGSEDRRTGPPDRRQNPNGPLPNCGDRRKGPKDRRVGLDDRRGASPLLLSTEKSAQKEQGFETLPSKKEIPGAVQEGVGRRPILEKATATDTKEQEENVNS